MSLRRTPRRLPNRRATMYAAVAVSGVVLLSGCGAEDKPSSDGEDSQYLAGTGRVTTVPKEERQSAPDLSGETVDGEQLKLSDHEGKVIVLNVWGSWCPPCRSEAPGFAKVSKEMEKENVQFIGINTKDLDVANAKAFDRTYGITYPSFFDPSGKQVLRFPKGSLNPQTIPSTLVLDTDGKIAVRALKDLSEEELREILKPVVAEAGGAEPPPADAK
ncbi:TlpA family protein disulfide reductase [Streptomyces sp. P38-E01]|uniref:TlpA family protein disulfide reductase n=1 Tax=Streptomyces tardus TaxID=2780544 RepID=A0A949JE61_9ACTN|nr:TlpA disulfide reductase family protein [Streptomyces tardus]MBU7598286.1 TlpA family protein disulfide reductase [Streptomyces tardus]